MQIHELNNYNGDLDSAAFLAVDNGSDTGKVSAEDLTAEIRSDLAALETDLNGRIDNIIAGGAAPSEAEIIDARRGANGIDYASLGAAIRGQYEEVNGEVGELASLTGSRLDLDLSYTEGKFVDSTGYYGTSAGYAYSEPVTVKRGSKIIFDAVGYQTNVSMISLAPAQGSTYHEPLVTSHTGANHYEYEVPADMSIVFSFKVPYTNLDIIYNSDNESIQAVEDDIDALTELTTTATYSGATPVGTLYESKNAQIDPTLTKVNFVNGNSNYKCIVIDDVSDIEYLIVYCSASYDARYGAGVIFATTNNFVIKEIYNPGGTSAQTALSFTLKVPDGTEKIFINGVYITPTANKVDRTLEFKGVSSEIVNGMLDYKDLTYINGYYIMANGSKSANDAFKYSESFHLKPCHLMVKARGYLTNVAILSKGKTSDETVKPLIMSTDSTYKVYSIDITEEGDYLVCTYAQADAVVVAMPLVYSDYYAPYCDISIFRKFGVIGDSFASGELYYGGGYHDKYFNSWGQVMARKHGTICTNYSSGGLTTRSWLTDSKGLPLLNASDPDDIYYLVLGINDNYSLGLSYLGSISDIGKRRVKQ